MPLDGHAYLSSQGWPGTGSGLREGAVSRPVIIIQKKTLAGIGKDRDEAFPFWDHLYSAAAKAIKLKVADSDEEDSADTEQSSSVIIARTRTGILSNRRPVEGTPASSGAVTPDSGSSDSSGPKLSLLTLARKEAAKKGLYSMFFRGPVLGPDEDAIPTDEDKAETTSDTLPATIDPSAYEKKKRRKEKERDLSKKCKTQKVEGGNEDKTAHHEGSSIPSWSQGHADVAEGSCPRKKKRTPEEKLARKAEKAMKKLAKLSRSTREGTEQCESSTLGATDAVLHSKVQGPDAVLDDGREHSRSKKRRHREENVNNDGKAKSYKKKKHKE
ncbi:hypothetical protein NEOLEDRAFT_1173578 [Neolentinus lepideus HHB14362 ss-1]|uniref:G-patch domain-containing protein n=1 Tax=Neolentinus lepideus HHB14362 ss-1 TaxID=1314782 RepID=A0A165MK58_9AGAM|nr:hypothetical protein NEOLEDRAFT_1173578 [Neolentinus lepideus HHB14362 ss-1]